MEGGQTLTKLGEGASERAKAAEQRKGSGTRSEVCGSEGQMSMEAVGNGHNEARLVLRVETRDSRREHGSTRVGRGKQRHIIGVQNHRLIYMRTLSNKI